MRRFRIIMIAFSIFLLLPVASAAISSIAASVMGCMLDEAGPHPCQLLGADIGELLTVMFVSGWYMLVTLPALAALLLAWGVVEASRWFAKG